MSLIAGDPGYVYPSVEEVTAQGRSIINVFGYTQWADRYILVPGSDPDTFDKQATFFATAVLPQWSGYMIIVLFSVFFALMAWFLMWVEERFAGISNSSAEQFTTAGRSLKTGLLAVDIVSHWTWPGNLLGAAYWCYTYGVTGAMWWAAGMTTSCWLFAVMAIELKMRAPTAHTILEIIKARWGTAAHVTFLCFCLAVNLLVTAQQMQATCLILNYLTGINLYAAGFLIPLGVVLYAGIGGLKATFTTSYLHTIIFLSIMNYMMYVVFKSSSLLGSIDLVYDRISKLSEYYPVSGNYQGSFLTAHSQGGYQNMLVIFMANLAYVFGDQSYWQSAIAAEPAAAIKGYVLGSFLFFPVAYSLCFVGLGALALDLPVSPNEVTNGAVIAAVLYAMSGKIGPILVLIATFMAVTSAGAGEMLATSSLFTFDVWRMYIRPKASSYELTAVCRCGVLFWGIISGLCVVVLFKGNINLLLFSLFPGVVLPSCVPGILASLLWNKCTALAAILSAVLGCIAGTTVWVRYPIYANLDGGINVSNLTFFPLGLLYGSATAIGSSVFLLVTVTFLERAIRPASRRTFEWSYFAEKINLADANKSGIEASSENSMETLRKARRLVGCGAVVVFLLLMVAWPTLSLIQPIFSLGNFRWWIVFAFIMCGASLLIAAVLPLWEARKGILMVGKHLVSGSRPAKVGPPETRADSDAKLDSYSSTELA